MEIVFKFVPFPALEKRREKRNTATNGYGCGGGQTTVKQMSAAGHQRGNLKFRKMNFVEQTVRYTLAGFKTELRCIFGTVSSVESVFSCRGRACVCWVAVFTNSIVTDAQTKIKQGLTNQHRALRYIYRRGARKERQERRETRKKGRKAAPLFAFRVTSTKTLINSLK